MKRNAGLLLVLILPLAVHAQLRGKIAIVHSPYFPSALDTIVKTESIEPVEVDSTLPASLNSYDALFLQAMPYSIDSATQFQLVGYINSGGMLYVEAQQRVADSVDSGNPLWVRFGIKRNVYTALEFSVNSVHGLDSQFTSNIFDALPMDVYQSGLGGPSGPIVPILVADGGGVVQALAYISEDASLRMVFSEASNYYPGYYSVFLRDVICDYFHLCTEAVKPATQFTSQDNFSIVRDSRGNGYSISADFTTGGEVSVLNSLGTLLWRTNVQAGDDLIELPVSLRNGVYFVTVRHGNKTGVKPLAIVN